jgi:hypothetical protein
MLFTLNACTTYISDGYYVVNGFATPAQIVIFHNTTHGHYLKGRCSNCAEKIGENLLAKFGIGSANFL